MKIKSAILVFSAALMMTSMLAGCGGNKDMNAKGVRTNNVAYDGTNLNRPGSTMYSNRTGMGPYGTGALNGNYGTYSVNDRGIYSMQDRANRNPVDGYGYNTAHRYNTGNYGANSYGMNNTSRSGMTMNHKIATDITKIPGVKSANVMLTNQNAYVAVATHSKTGMKSTSTVYPHSYTARGNGGTAGSTGTTADIPAQLKSKIADIVKKADPNVKNVYVSSDVNFVDRMNDYAGYVREGRPLHGLNVEFQDMINRIFPTNAAKQPAPMR